MREAVTSISFDKNIKEKFSKKNVKIIKGRVRRALLKTYEMHHCKPISSKKGYRRVEVPEDLNIIRKVQKSLKKIKFKGKKISYKKGSPVCLISISIKNEVYKPINLFYK
jgi:hypothetical protein